MSGCIPFIHDGTYRYIRDCPDSFSITQFQVFSKQATEKMKRSVRCFYDAEKGKRRAGKKLKKMKKTLAKLKSMC